MWGHSRMSLKENETGRALRVEQQETGIFIFRVLLTKGKGNNFESSLNKEHRRRQWESFRKQSPWYVWWALHSKDVWERCLLQCCVISSFSSYSLIKFELSTERGSVPGTAEELSIWKKLLMCAVLLESTNNWRVKLLVCLTPNKWIWNTFKSPSEPSSAFPGHLTACLWDEHNSEAAFPEQLPMWTNVS